MNETAQGRITYTSQLPKQHLTQLQELMFFNAKQGEFRGGIISSIEEFGEPRVERHGEFLRVHTSLLGEVQSLFALEERGEESRPIAAMVFARTAEDTVTLLHIGVDEDYAADGPFAEKMITLQMFRRLTGIGRQIKGVRRIVVLYGPEGRNEIRVRH